MNKTFWNRFLDSCSDNRKSKTCPELSRRIENLKWAGVVAIVLAITVCGTRAEAQQPKKVPRIGVLSPGSPGPSPLLDAFRQGLRELGYVEGQNIAVEYRFAEANPEPLSDLAGELVRLKVDVILTINTGGIRRCEERDQDNPDRLYVRCRSWRACRQPRAAGREHYRADHSCSGAQWKTAGAN